MSVMIVCNKPFAACPSSSSKNDLQVMYVWFVVKGSLEDVLRFAFRGLWKLFFVSRSGFFGRWVFAACLFGTLAIGSLFPGWMGRFLYKLMGLYKNARGVLGNDAWQHLTSQTKKLPSRHFWTETIPVNILLREPKRPLHGAGLNLAPIMPPTSLC